MAKSKKIKHSADEDLFKAEVERAKTRTEVLGSHRGPSKKVRGYSKAPKVKTERMKTFYFKTNLQSWKDFLEKKISMTDLKSLQKTGQ